jgi:hypothetical protein
VCHTAPGEGLERGLDRKRYSLARFREESEHILLHGQALIDITDREDSNP